MVLGIWLKDYEDGGYLGKGKEKERMMIRMIVRV